MPINKGSYRLEIYGNEVARICEKLKFLRGVR